jgi:hypothetical protein
MSNINVAEVFEKRDGLSKSEANKERNRLQGDVMSAIGAGASYDEIEDIMLGEGLEMDYFEDFI